MALHSPVGPVIRLSDHLGRTGGKDQPPESSDDQGE